jgi:hypothetical protein
MSVTFIFQLPAKCRIAAITSGTAAVNHIKDVLEATISTAHRTAMPR